MRKMTTMAILGIATIAATLPASAAKIEGSTILKDSQPAGTTDKEHKHQAYYLSFEAQGKSYTCRTSSGKSINATDFVVGTHINYQIEGDKTKIKTPQGKQIQCKIVRVEAVPAR
jgi:hypothetical protein